MRFKNPITKGVLCQHPVPSTTKMAMEMKDRLTALQQQLRRTVEAGEDPHEAADVRIVLRYLDTYWDKFFGHVIYPEAGGQPLLLHRTNNVAEHTFDDLKQGERRKAGTKKLARCIHAMRPEQLLVANLANPEYIDALYGGSLTNMPAYFASVWTEAKEIRQARYETISSHRIPVSKKSLRNPEWLPKMEEALTAMIAITLGNLSPARQT
jgi:hypothetical protein